MGLPSARTPSVGLATAVEFVLLTVAGGMLSWRYLRALTRAPDGVSRNAPLTLTRATIRR